MQTQTQNWPVEVIMLFPAAAMETAKKDRTQEKPRICVEHRGDRVRLKISGSASAEFILDKLDRLLDTAAGYSEVDISFEQANPEDQLALSALMVSLRRHADVFQRISLHGLQGWATLRLNQTGACNMLGSGWEECMEADGYRLRRQAGS